MLATYVRRMRKYNLEIRIAGFSNNNIVHHSNKSVFER